MRWKKDPADRPERCGNDPGRGSGGIPVRCDPGKSPESFSCSCALLGPANGSTPSSDRIPAYAVLVGLHVHIAFIVLPDVFLDHLVEGFVYVYVTRKHDIVLIVLQDLEKLEKPVFHGGIGDPGVPGSETEGDIAEQVEEIFDPFADRDPVVLKQRSGKDCEGSSAVSAPVSLYAVGREAVLFEIDRSAVSAALWRKAVDQICFVGAFQFGMSVVVGIKIV